MRGWLDGGPCETAVSTADVESDRQQQKLQGSPGGRARRIQGQSGWANIGGGCTALGGGTIEVRGSGRGAEWGEAARAEPGRAK